MPSLTAVAQKVLNWSTAAATPCRKTHVFGQGALRTWVVVPTGRQCVTNPVALVSCTETPIWGFADTRSRYRISGSVLCADPSLSPGSRPDDRSAPSDVTDQAGKVGRLIGVIDRQFAATVIDGQPEMRCGRRCARPALSDGHHLHSHFGRFRLSGCCDQSLLTLLGWLVDAEPTDYRCYRRCI